MYLDETFAEASKGCSLLFSIIFSFIRNLNVLQDSRKRLGGQVESWQGFCCPIFMKLSGKLLLDVLFHLRPSPGTSGTSMSSKTPGTDLDDRWSLDWVSDVQSSWNFQGSFSWISSSIWDHHQVHQEPPCPPRLQEETWRTGGVLTGFLRSKINETFREASLGLGYSILSETITRCLHVIFDYRKFGIIKTWFFSK